MKHGQHAKGMPKGSHKGMPKQAVKKNKGRGKKGY